MSNKVFTELRCSTRHNATDGFQSDQSGASFAGGLPQPQFETHVRRKTDGSHGYCWQSAHATSSRKIHLIEGLCESFFFMLKFDFSSLVLVCFYQRYPSLKPGIPHYNLPFLFKTCYFLFCYPL